MDKVERQVQLVTLLLGARQPMPFKTIRDKMPEFYGQADPASAKRKFERDKDELRDMGVPISLEPLDNLVQGEQGYRILPDAYYLPEIAFTPEESAALTVLASDPVDDDAVVQGLRKLIYGVAGGPLSAAGSVVAPGPDRLGGKLSGVLDALGAGRAVSFQYRNASGEMSDRTIDPYGIATRNGHWYVVGLDRATNEVRAFRASRAVSDLVMTDDQASSAPDGFDAAEHISGPWENERDGRATIAVHPRVAWWARRTLRGATDNGERHDGWQLLEVPVTRDLASSVLRFGADAEALDPPELRDAIVAILKEVVDGQG